jgi:hypothetical protein
MTTALEAMSVALLAVGAALGLGLLLWLAPELFGGSEHR